MAVQRSDALKESRWLSNGLLKLPKDLCEGHSQCLVSSRFSNESKEAIPVDQLVIDSTHSESLVLLLPKGKFEVSVEDSSGAALRSFTVGK